MDIRFRCPACNRKLSVDGSRAGEQVPCPLCNEKIRIPAEDVNARVKELESENRKLRFKMEAAQKEAESLMATEMALWKAEASIKETSGLETKLAEAKQKLADLSSERNTLRGNLSGLEKTAKECKDLKAKITALTAERDKISAARDKLKEDVDARPTQARLDAVTTERDDFRESGARLQAALDQKETRIADLERQTAEQKKRESQREEELLSIRTNLEATEIAARESAATAFSEAEDLRAENNRHFETITQLKKDLLEWQTKADAALAEREGVVQNSTDQRERLKETVHELETARADHQTAIADGKKLSSELDTARGEIETLTARIADLEPQAARIPELESGRDTLQAQLDERAKELSSASGRGEELSTELQQRQDTIASFERTIEESTRTIESLRANQTRLEADLADARDRASSLQATVDEFNTLRGKTAALEDSHAAAVEESRMLLKDASRRSGQVKELETEILTLRNELNARVQDVAKRTAEIEKLQDEITVFKEREADREEANRELDSLIAKASELDELRASSIQTNATLERVLREIEGVREEHATTTAELKAAERRLEIVEEEDQRRLTRGEAKGLRRQVKELKARNETYTKLSEKLRGLRDEVFSALGPEVREEKGPVDVLNALRETRGQAYARMDQLEERLSITLDEKAELQLELTAINHTLSGSMGKLESFQRRADDAEQRLAELVKERTFIDSRVEEAIGQRTADTQRISDLENLLKANGAEAAHAENKALREELDRMQGAFDEAGNRMVALLEQVKHQSAFQEQLVKATRRVSILENEIVDLQSDLEEKRMQLAEANLRLDMEKKS